MKKVKAPGARTNVVSVKPMPRVTEPLLPGRAGFMGPGLNVVRSTKSYKKGK